MRQPSISCRPCSLTRNTPSHNIQEDLLSEEEVLKYGVRTLRWRTGNSTDSLLLEMFRVYFPPSILVSERLHPFPVWSCYCGFLFPEAKKCWPEETNSQTNDNIRCNQCLSSEYPPLENGGKAAMYPTSPRKMLNFWAGAAEPEEVQE